jgi:hypothetical protein
MSQDNMVICYEGIQRVYRNAIVKYLRSKLHEAFPIDYETKLRAPFQKEWDVMKQNALATRLSGTLNAGLSDEFDLLSVNHFFNLFDAYYDVLLAHESPASSDEKRKQKQAILNWTRTVKELRDPLSHPAEEGFTKEDSYVLLDSARRVLMRLHLYTEAQTVKSLMERVMGSNSPETIRDPLEDQLPHRESIVMDFIGRDKEIDELWRWFSDPVSRRWALAGEGGKGKSALAYNFGLEVKFKAPQPFQAVFWLSAKKRKFLEGLVVANTPEFSDFEGALSRVLTAYGWVDELSQPISSKSARVLELLNEFPVLLIVDDIDSLDSSNEDVIEFFSFQVPQTKSKVLFTSRRVIFGMGNTTTHVSGFSEEDAEKFIMSRCGLLGIDVRNFDRRTIESIVKATDGSPLFIEDLIRLSAVTRSINAAIDMWKERGGNIARKYALGREVELLTVNAKKVLFAACLGTGHVSFAELEAVTGLTSDYVTAALQELQKLFLVPKPKLIEGEQRFEVNVNTRALVRDVYGSDDFYRKVESIYKSISGQVSKTTKGDVGIIIRQAMFLQSSDKFQEAERLILNAIDTYHGEADLFSMLGRVYRAWNPPRLTDAREKYQRAWQLKCRRPDMYDQWCTMEMRETEWGKAAEAAEKGLVFLQNNRRLLFLAGYTRSRIARQLRNSFNEELSRKENIQARKYLERAIKAPANKQDPRDVDLCKQIYRALVLACELGGDHTSMNEYLKDWRREYPEDSYLSIESDRINKKYGRRD